MSKLNTLLMPLILLFASSSVFSTPPQNLASLKKNITKYYQSKAYAQDVNQAVKPAEQYLTERATQNPEHKKLAVVFDIDDTLITNFPLIKANDYGETWPYIMYTMKEGHSPAIPGTQRLYNLAKQYHVSIFLITGRTEDLRDVTIKNLHKDGYSDWTQLILEPKNYKGKSAAIYKTAERKNIEKQGYDIVLTVGDQYSDLNGGYADKTIKIPNPIYIVQ